MPSPDPFENMVNEILAHLASLPLAEQNEAIIVLVGKALSQMPRRVVEEVRGEIVEQFAPDIPIVREVLELIDGHLTLRDMGIVREPDLG